MSLDLGNYPVFTLRVEMQIKCGPLEIFVIRAEQGWQSARRCVKTQFSLAKILYTLVVHLRNLADVLKENAQGS